MTTRQDDDPDARTFAGSATWAAIRESYLNGVSAPALERRYGVKRATIWKRAERHGWRGAKAPETPPPEALSRVRFPMRIGAMDPAASARDAAEAADQCMREGRLEEAGKLARLALTLTRLSKTKVWSASDAYYAAMSAGEPPGCQGDG